VEPASIPVEDFSLCPGLLRKPDLRNTPDYFAISTTSYFSCSWKTAENTGQVLLTHMTPFLCFFNPLFETPDRIQPFLTRVDPEIWFQFDSFQYLP
jgi:hypothetical protein